MRDLMMHVRLVECFKVLKNIRPHRSQRFRSFPRSFFIEESWKYCTKIFSLWCSYRYRKVYENSLWKCTRYFVVKTVCLAVFFVQQPIKALSLSKWYCCAQLYMNEDGMYRISDSQGWLHLLQKVLLYHISLNLQQNNPVLQHVRTIEVKILSWQKSKNWKMPSFQSEFCNILRWHRVFLLRVFL